MRETETRLRYKIFELPNLVENTARTKKKTVINGRVPLKSPPALVARVARQIGSVDIMQKSHSNYSKQMTELQATLTHKKKN